MFRTRTPLSRFRRISTARLACVRPPASVHPEPGSNSPLYVCLTHSKLTSLWFFLLLGCYIFYFNDLFFFRFLKNFLICHLLFLICECKSKNFFWIDKIFFEKFLFFFRTFSFTISYLAQLNLPLFQYLNLAPTLPFLNFRFLPFGSAKVRRFV